MPGLTSMSAETRNDLINVLVIMTGKRDSYYSNMTDKRILEEYDRLMESSRGN